MNKADYYTYSTTWFEQDQQFAGLCTEFPSLSWLEDSPDKALDGIRTLVTEVLEEMSHSEEAIPEPLSKKQYSGKFVVRVHPAQHRNLVVEAASNQMSLNSLIKYKLSFSSFDSLLNFNSNPRSNLKKHIGQNSEINKAPKGKSEALK